MLLIAWWLWTWLIRTVALTYYLKSDLFILEWRIIFHLYTWPGDDGVMPTVGMNQASYSCYLLLKNYLLIPKR